MKSVHIWVYVHITEFHENVTWHLLVIARVWCTPGQLTCILRLCASSDSPSVGDRLASIPTSSVWEITTKVNYLSAVLQRNARWPDWQRNMCVMHPQTLTVEFPLLGNPSVVKWPTRQRLLHMWHSIKLSLAHGYHSNQIKHTLSTCTE